MSAPIRPQPGHPGTYRHDGLPCPACGKHLDAMTNTDKGGRAAEDGDYSVCAGCGVMSIFVVGPFGVAFRAPSADELAEFMRDYKHVLARGSYGVRPRPSGCNLPGHRGCTVWECRPDPELT